MGNSTVSLITDKQTINSIPTQIWRLITQKNVDYYTGLPTETSHGAWEFFKPTPNSELIFAQIKKSFNKSIRLLTNEKHVNLFFTQGCHINIKGDGQQPHLIPSEHASMFLLPQQNISLQLKASPCAFIFILQLPLDALADCIYPSVCPELKTLSGKNFRLSKKSVEIIDAICKNKSSLDLRACFISGKTYELVDEILQNFQHTIGNCQSSISYQENVDITQKAEAILHKLYTSPPSLEQLARSIGTNRNKLSNSFKAIHGKTVFEYCQQYRMSIAKRMLSEHELSISRIAEIVGYEHASNFTSAYKRHYGELPKATQRIRA